jgi:hypothetical protein
MFPHTCLLLLLRFAPHKLLHAPRAEHDFHQCLLHRARLFVREWKLERRKAYFSVRASTGSVQPAARVAAGRLARAGEHFGLGTPAESKLRFR